MSADGAETVGGTGPGGTAAAPGGGEPTEDELRAAYEAELSRLTTTDMIAQTAVSLLNLGARRLAPPGEDPARPSERDLDQARDAIDAVRALLEILERRIPQELRPLREALSRLQMAYARELSASPTQTAPTTQPTPAGTGAPTPPSAEPTDAGPSGEPAAGGAARAEAGDSAPDAGEQPPGPGPAESSGRLWVPGR
ncbi:MAG TPA: hypothetical protein VK721_07715 [Solirubrobacteraceae bacterium]|nr:hypothetical protein [Solirubrobacteraceae bacterium]